MTNKQKTDAMVDAMVDAFLAWPLPSSVCSDPCASIKDYKHPRCGTNLLTATEAKQMFEYVLNKVKVDKL